METLSKENFWNKLQEKFPKQFEEFVKWIDEYKAANNWNSFTNEFNETKFHDLPLAMQFGVFMQYATEVDNTVIITFTSQVFDLSSVSKAIKEWFIWQSLP